MDPGNIEAIENMDFPETADELCLFLHFCRWMANFIPEFQYKSKMLSEFLVQAYKQSEKRRKSLLKRIGLYDLSCDTIHESYFLSLNKGLQSAVGLAILNKMQVRLMFTDVLKKLWVGVVTQVENEETEKENQEQVFSRYCFQMENLRWVMNTEQLTGRRLSRFWKFWDTESHPIWFKPSKRIHGQPLSAIRFFSVGSEVKRLQVCHRKFTSLGYSSVQVSDCDWADERKKSVCWPIDRVVTGTSHVKGSMRRKSTFWRTVISSLYSVGDISAEEVRTTQWKHMRRSGESKNSEGIC